MAESGRTHRASALLGLALAWLAFTAIAGSAAADGRAWPEIRSPLAGYELRYPPGWHGVARSDASIVISSWLIARPEGFPFRPPGSVYIFVHDYGRLHAVKPFPLRPARLRLPSVSSYEGFGTGSMLRFRQAGHNFQVFVSFGDGASAATRALALRTLATLRTTASPLANDHQTVMLGRSVQGRPIRVFHFGDFASRRTVLVVGCIHGTECAGMQVALQLVNNPTTRANLWVIQDLNPDGLRAGTRTNADGVDLNRNFPAGWRPIGSRGDPQYAGPDPFSEPETRIVRGLIERVHPRVTIWYHQPARLVRAWGGSVAIARRYAQLAGLPFRRLPWLAGTAPNWQNHRFHGTASFVVELPPGSLTVAAARRQERTVLALAAGLRP